MVNFTFVSHKGARPEKSELVKSHVMRESQKRRREAKERYRHGISSPYEPCPPSPLSHTQTLRRAKSVAQPPSHRDSADRSGSPVSISSSGRRASDISNDQQLHSSRLPEPAKLNSARLLKAQMDSRPGSATEMSLRLNIDNGIHARYSQQHVLGPKFHRFANGADPSWMPETWLNRVDEIVSHYFSSFNGTGPDSRSTLTHWFRQPLRSPLILLSYSLLYCAHRDLIWGIVGNDDHYFKARNLQFINVALEDRATALADETIVAVVSMAMYENLRGSDQVITHELGSRQMFDMRGGIEKFMSEEGFYVGNFALLVDMVYSTCSNKQPIFSEIATPVLRDVHVDLRKSYFVHSPLRVVDSPGFHRTMSIGELRSSLDVLREAFDVLEMLCMEAFHPDLAAKEAVRFRLRRDKAWARLQAYDTSDADTSALTTEGKIKEAVRIAGMVHCCAVVFQIQHDDESNQQPVGRLQAILKSLQLDFWKTAPYLYLWILLTGGAACSRLPEIRAYFVSEITRVGITVGFFDWRSFTQVVNNFLWLQDFLRKQTKGYANSKEISIQLDRG